MRPATSRWLLAAKGSSENGQTSRFLAERRSSQSYWFKLVLTGLVDRFLTKFYARDLIVNNSCSIGREIG